MNKQWSERFSKAQNSEVENFTALIMFDCTLGEEDILGSLAHVRMLVEVGILTAMEAEEICKGLLKVLDGFNNGQISFSVADEDIHMKVERELKHLIGPLAGKLHTARSRNDQTALVLHLYLRKKAILIVDRLLELSQQLLAKAKTNSQVIMPGYTHLQRAQPILFAHHLLAYFAMFQRDMERLQDSWPRINQLPLGAGALAGTGFPIDRQTVADLLHFDCLYENSIDAVSDRDFCIEFLANAALIMTHLSRLSEEIVLWSSQEFAFIELDDAYCTGSSMMPQKKNPDVPELVRGKTGRVYGSLVAMLTTMKGLPLSYNKDMQEDKEAIFDTVETVERSLSIYKGVIATFYVNSERMLQAAQEGFLNATELADYLAAKGMPFREAHAVVSKIVRYCLDHHYQLEKLALDKLQSFSPLFGEDVKTALDLKNMINKKNSRGGTSSEQVEHQCRMAEEKLDKIKKWVEDKQKLMAAAKKNLYTQEVY